MDRGKERIEKSISKLVSKGKMTQDDADKSLATIQWTTDVKDLTSMDFIVEAGTLVYLHICLSTRAEPKKGCKKGRARVHLSTQRAA